LIQPFRRRADQGRNRGRLPTAQHPQRSLSRASEAAAKRKDTAEASRDRAGRNLLFDADLPDLPQTIRWREWMGGRGGDFRHHPPRRSRVARWLS